MSQAPAPSPLPLPPDASASPRAPRAPFAFSPYSSSPPSSSLPPSSTASPRRSPTKRRLVLRAGPETFVASESRLDGTLSLGTGCVIHPKATVIAAAGASIFLGDGVVIEEMAEVLFRGPGRATIGSGTVVMVGAVVDLVPDSPEGSRAVGEWCTFAPRSRCLGVRVGDSCTVGAGTSVGPNHKAVEGGMPSRTVIYGSASEARTWDGSGEGPEKEVRVNATAFLREILPKFNKARDEAPGVQTQR